MGGRPNDFQVTNLEVLEPGALPGAEMKDVIGMGNVQPPETAAFDLLVTFEISNTQNWWIGFAEGLGGFQATAEFYAESIGPGPEISIGTNPVGLVPGGNPGGSGVLNRSLYQVRLAVPDAGAVFVDANGNPAPGLFRIGCTVVIPPPFAGVAPFDAYYQQDLVVRVAQRP